MSFSGTWTVSNPAVGFTLTTTLTNSAGLVYTGDYDAVVGYAVGPATVTWAGKAVVATGLHCIMMRHVYIDISQASMPTKMDHSLACQTPSGDIEYVFDLKGAAFGPMSPVTGPSGYANANDGSYFGLPTLVPLTLTKS